MSLTSESFMGPRPHDYVDTTFGKALGAELRARHRFHTAKQVSRDLRVTVKTAENILEGHISSRTVTLIVLAYGPGPVINAAASTAGHTLETFIENQAADADRAARRAEERARELRSLRTRLDAPARRGDGGNGAAA